jgi:FtsH-binding integral membrane protein
MDMGLILMGVGMLGAAVGGIWLIVCAFQKGIVWGLCYMFVPFAALVYVVVDFRKAWRPAAIHVVSVLVALGGVVISPNMQDAFAKAKAEAQAQSAAGGMEGVRAGQGTK